MGFGGFVDESEEFYLVHMDRPVCSGCHMFMQVADPTKVIVTLPQNVGPDNAGFDIYTCCSGVVICPVTRRKKPTRPTRFNRKDVV